MLSEYLLHKDLRHCYVMKATVLKSCDQVSCLFYPLSPVLSRTNHRQPFKLSRLVSFSMNWSDQHNLHIECLEGSSQQIYCAMLSPKSPKAYHAVWPTTAPIVADNSFSSAGNLVACSPCEPWQPDTNPSCRADREHLDGQNMTNGPSSLVRVTDST